MRFFPAFVLVSILFVSFPSSVFCQSYTIESQGVAAIVQGSVDISRDKAIEDALRKAVEQATGSLIENQTLVENYQLISDKIYSQSRGYVQSYEVISEGADQAGLYRVSIKAEVRGGDLRNDLQALKVLMRQVRKPRVMVIFQEDSTREVDGGKMAESFLSKALLDRGFKLVDPDIVRRNMGHAKMRGLFAGDESVAAAIGTRYGAEILLVGSAQTVSQNVKIGDVDINSHRVAVNARLIRSDTGEVKASESTQAVKPHINRLAGTELAMREAIESLANALVERIVSIFQEQVYNVVNIKVLMSGLKDYGQLQEVIKLLSANIRGIREIFQRNYTTGTAELEIELTGSAESLASDLASRRFGRYEFNVNEMTRNQLQITLTLVNR